MTAVLIRRGVKADVPLIASSWLKAFRAGPAVECVPNTLYFRAQHRMLEQVIPGSILLVACNEEDPNQILGWCCAIVAQGALILHFMYVKGTFRGFGIARKMFDTLKEIYISEADRPYPGFFFYTHRVRVNKITTKKYGAIYNPYLLWANIGDTEYVPQSDSERQPPNQHPGSEE